MIAELFISLFLGIIFFSGIILYHIKKPKPVIEPYSYFDDFGNEIPESQYKWNRFTYISKALAIFALCIICTPFYMTYLLVLLAKLIYNFVNFR